MTFLLDIGVLPRATLSWGELIIDTFCIPQIPLSTDANFLKMYCDSFHLGLAQDVVISHPSRAEISCYTDLLATPFSLHFFTRHMRWAQYLLHWHTATTALQPWVDRQFCLKWLKSRCIQVCLFLSCFDYDIYEFVFSLLLCTIKSHRIFTSCFKMIRSLMYFDNMKCASWDEMKFCFDSSISLY